MSYHPLAGGLSLCIAVLAACDATKPVRVSPAPQLSAQAPLAMHTGEANQALEELDHRTPVPLLPMMANHQRQNMRDHLMAVQEIIAGVGADDFSSIEEASRRIGYSEQMGQMCSHMGLGAPGFTERAIAFHRTADTITAAARQHDGRGVLAALSTTLAACTGCHAAFRQQVVDDATWASIAGASRGARP